ncbi:hypothetical protein GCM10009539_09660 [Cryptosporangium japonicum]|uniref:SAF domain-containing protein n=1 Tax=Cryptosporangium japonicum TaxID=80872 RepID=A0ABN0TNY1_9ACTN
MVAGARLFAAADRTAPVWAVTRDLGAGTVLTRGDVEVVRVRLPGRGAQYLAAGGAAPVGRSLTRDVGAGELLPRAALIDRACGSEVSIPVAALHVPATVRRGVKVDVFATAREGEPTRVLAAVTVQDAVRGSDLGGGSALVVRVADELAPAVVRAVRTAEIDVVVVAGRSPGDGCGGSAGPSGSPTPGATLTFPPAPTGPATTGSTRTGPDGADPDGGGG